MPFSAQSLTVIRNLFQNRGYNDPSVNLSGDGRKFELYVYTLVCTAITNAGYNLIPQNANGDPFTNVFRFNATTAQLQYNHSYFQFSANNSTYQVRNGIRTMGEHMDHEVDIVVYKDLIPNVGVAPGDSIKLAIECKHYANSNFKGVSRQYLGMISDFSDVAGNININIPANGAANSFYKAFVTNMNIRIGPMTYLNNYNLNPKEEIIGNDPNALALITELTQYFSTL